MGYESEEQKTQRGGRNALSAREVAREVTDVVSAGSAEGNVKIVAVEKY